jgi:TetR/AcrR family transcriptional regulator, cholesterol catabolism regulator
MRIRARNEEDKLERRQAILDAGLELWNETSYADFTMSAVAEKAGLVKGTLYLYFETKEQLFLALVSDMMADYFDEVDARLQEGGRWSKPRVVQILSGAFTGRDAFTRMLTVLGNICEHNVSYEQLVAFKRLTLDRFTRTAALLARRLPFLSAETALRLVMHLGSLAAGLAQVSFPSPLLDKVLDLPDLRVMRVDLKTEFAAAAAALVTGMEKAR